MYTTMQRTTENERDNVYMYQFRTKSCTKNRCRNRSKCFDAHSQVMRRRVPRLRPDGLFNYIPESCPQWQKAKKCNKGDSCHRSHGWLEIIFHPLLFKTKICKSNHKNGVCREYGVYCAKAHNPTEIRNLVKIYGENWKRHYDLSLRDTDATSSNMTRSQRSSSSSAGYSRMQLDGDFLDDRMDHRNLGSRYYSEQKNPEAGTPTKVSSASTSYRVDSSSANSPFHFASSPLFGGYNSICNLMADISLDKGAITSYTQLYSESVNSPEAKNSEKNADAEMTWDGSWHSPTNAVPLQESPSSSSSNSYFMSPFRDTWRISDPLDLDWKMDAKQDEKENPPHDEYN